MFLTVSDLTVAHGFVISSVHVGFGNAMNLVPVLLYRIRFVTMWIALCAIFCCHGMHLLFTWLLQELVTTQIHFPLVSRIVFGYFFSFWSLVRKANVVPFFLVHVGYISAISQHGTILEAEVRRAKPADPLRIMLLGKITRGPVCRNQWKTCSIYFSWRKGKCVVLFV